MASAVSVAGEPDDEYQLVSFPGREEPVRIDLCYNESAMRPLFDGAGTEQPAVLSVNCS